MIRWFSKLIDRLSEIIANRKGLLPLIAILLAILNYILRVTASGWVVETDLLLHLAFIIGVLGLLLARAL